MSEVIEIDSFIKIIKAVTNKGTF